MQKRALIKSIPSTKTLQKFAIKGERRWQCRVQQHTIVSPGTGPTTLGKYQLVKRKRTKAPVKLRASQQEN